MNSCRLFVRSNDYRKFMNGVNKFISYGYVLKRIKFTRRWFFWYDYLATFSMPYNAAHVILDIGPITNRV